MPQIGKNFLLCGYCKAGFSKNDPEASKKVVAHEKRCVRRPSSSESAVIDLLESTSNVLEMPLTLLKDTLKACGFTHALDLLETKIKENNHAGKKSQP